MPLVVRDRVKETTTTTGTGTLTLAGAAAGFQSFSVIGNGNTTYYTITNGIDWEVGIGTYTSSGTTLSRDTILESSNSGSAVNWGSGSKDVFVTYPAERAVYVDGSSITPGSSASLPIANGGTGQTTQTAAFDALAPTTTKGDLIVSNGTDNVRIGVGTNGYVLTADSAEAVGVKWAAASGGGGSPITISNKTGAYTVVAGDLGTIINCTSGTFTVSLTAAATLGSGFNCWVWNTGTDTITIDPNASETIDSRTTLVLRRGEGTQVICDGTNWQTGDKKTMRGYSDNITAGDTRPEASGTEAIALGNFSRATGANGVSIGRATLASGDSSVAIGRGPTASASYSTAIGTNSSIGGSQAVTGAGAMSLGGSYASGNDSFAAAIANNTSTYGAKGSNSVALGLNCVASGVRSVAIGRNCSSSNTSSLALGGDATASGFYGFAANGGQATAASSVAIGRSISSIGGKYTYAGYYTNFAADGDAQTGSLILKAATTNNVATVLVSDVSAAGTTNQVILPNSSAYAFTGLVVARRQASGGTESAAWKVEGLIRREANAASTTLVASTVTAISNAPGWTLALSADTTNGGLKVEATGAASTNIRWVATIQTSEVTYA